MAHLAKPDKENLPPAYGGKNAGRRENHLKMPVQLAQPAGLPGDQPF